MEKSRKPDAKSAFQAEGQSETDLQDVSLATPGLIQEIDRSGTRAGPGKASLRRATGDADSSGGLLESEEMRDPEEDLEIDDWVTPQVSRHVSDTTLAQEFNPEAEEKEFLGEQGRPIPESVQEQSDPRPGESRILQIIRPNGHWNKRLIYGVLGAVLIFVILGLGGGSRNKKAGETQPRPARTLKDSQDRAESAMQFSTAQEQTLGTPAAPPQQTSSDQADSVEATPPVEQREQTQAGSTPGPRALQSETSQAKNDDAEPADDQFAIVLRQGERTERETAADRKEAQRQAAAQKRKGGADQSSTQNSASKPVSGEELGILPRTRIDLTLSEPLRSGIATSVEARVIADVRDAQGNVVIPAGSTAVVPFLAYEVNGRVLNSRNESALFITPAGKQVSLRGVVKAEDGFAGLTGKVKKIGGRSTASRIFGGIARVGARSAADAVGDVSPEAEDEVNRATYDYRSPQFERTGRIVEVTSGTRFTFVVGR